jgi:hypothetical protein
MAHPKRLQFDFNADAIRRLERIKQVAERASYAEVVRDALRLFEWWVEQNRAGYEIGLVKDETLVKVVKFLF